MLRRRLGFYSRDPAVDANKASHTSMIRYGNEPRPLGGDLRLRASRSHHARDPGWRQARGARLEAAHAGPSPACCSRCPRGAGRGEAQSLGEVALGDGELPGGPEALALDGRHIWVARPFADALVKLSRRTAITPARSRSKGRAPCCMRSALWVASLRSNRVEAQPARRRRPRQLRGRPLAGRLSSPTARTSGWPTAAASSLTKLDAKGASSSPSACKRGCLAPAFDGAHVWVAEQQGAQRRESARQDGR